MTTREAVAAVFCCVGTFFFVVGTTGLLRMPDLFSRLHPVTKCDTLGACSVLVGMAVYTGFSWELPKLAVMMLFLLLSSATCGHAMGRAALKQGLMPWKRGESRR